MYTVGLLQEEIKCKIIKDRQEFKKTGLKTEMDWGVMVKERKGTQTN